MENGRYDFNAIEKKWQDYWLQNKTFKAPDGSSLRPSQQPPAPNPKDPLEQRPKYYVLDMFPYPSAQGLHVGHPEGYTASDIVARYRRMKGYNVLHPIGWDAFGLPAEQYAVQTGTHPAVTTQKNIENMRRQIQSLGFSYDWDRQVDTTDFRYYKWTQWIFLKFYNCPKCKIGLANEEVVDDKCERCGTQTERRNMAQWMLKITEYADRLIEDLETVEYLEKIKTQQVNWIGRSYGAEIKFQISNSNNQITVFTTRPDTIFGATFLVLSPEHELVNQITTAQHEA